MAGSNETLTNAWALWVDAGNVRFDDNIHWLSGTSFKGILDHANTADRTYTFPDATTTVVGHDTSQALSNKTISGAAPATPTANMLYSDNLVKGWVNFNGTGTPAINQDVNVSSITDNGTGDYTINWATSFSGADKYAISVEVRNGNAGGVENVIATIATDVGAGLLAASARIQCVDASNVAFDPLVVSVIAVGVQ